MFSVTLPQTRVIFLKEINKILFLTTFLDYFFWNAALKLDEQNVDYSSESFLNKINSLLSNYTPLKTLTSTNESFCRNHR